MPRTQGSELKLHYHVHGTGDPLVLVMGLGADSLAWVLQLKPFAERYRTVTFDNRDIGRSEYASGPYSVADMAGDTIALCDELGLDSFHLLGMSMGGTIAQEIALAAPERVRTLTLAVTWGGTGAYGRERSRLLGSTAMRAPREDHVDTLMILTMSENFYENGAAVSYMRNVMLSNPHPQAPEAFARQAEASGAHDARDRLSALSMPVHVIGAEHDVLVPVWKSRELADLIPGAKLTVIEGAPHAVNVERAEEFNRAVLDFLESPQ